MNLLLTSYIYSFLLGQVPQNTDSETDLQESGFLGVCSGNKTTRECRKPEELNGNEATMKDSTNLMGSSGADSPAEIS